MTDPQPDERRQPWLKFFPSDWRSDTGLQLCSYAARGLWAEMLFIMHRSRVYGHLIIGQKAPSAAELAKTTHGKPREVARLLAELESNGVFSKTDEGVIYSRRLVRDEDQRRHFQQLGRTGGNPELAKGSVHPTQRSIRFHRGSNPTKVRLLWEQSGGKCSYCGVEMNLDNPYAMNGYQIDHLIPIAEGGTNDIDNLVACCKRCNVKKGHRVDNQALRDDGLTGHSRVRAIASQKPEARSQDPERGERALRGAVFDGKRLRVPRFLHEDFVRALGASDFDIHGWYTGLDEELEQSGEPIDTLPWLQARFRKDANIPQPSKVLAVRSERDVTPKRRWDEDCHHEPKCQTLPEHQLREFKERQPA